MTISLLCDHPDFIEPISTFLWELWQHDFETLTSHLTTYETLRDFYTSTSKIPPCVYVYHYGDQLISACLVDVEDMGVHPEWQPWLANVITFPPYRNQGYASKLVAHVCAIYPTLHLWTFTPALAHFYAKHGFQQIEIIPHHGHLENIIVMVRNQK